MADTIKQTTAPATPAVSANRPYVDAVKALQQDLDDKTQRSHGANTATFDSEPKGRLTPQARALLIQTSEQNAAAPARSAQRKVAEHAAASLAALDYPQNSNPFKSSNDLAKIYDREQVNREISRQFGMKDPEKADGMRRALAESMRPGTEQLDRESARQDALAWQNPNNRPRGQVPAADTQKQQSQDIER